eukprot:1148843-Pelagomonas_calceolata.AAC.3
MNEWTNVSIQAFMSILHDGDDDDDDDDQPVQGPKSTATLQRPKSMATYVNARDGDVASAKAKVNGERTVLGSNAHRCLARLARHC